MECVSLAQLIIYTIYNINYIDKYIEIHIYLNIYQFYQIQFTKQDKRQDIKHSFIHYLHPHKKKKLCTRKMNNLSGVKSQRIEVRFMKRFQIAL